VTVLDGAQAADDSDSWSRRAALRAFGACASAALATGCGGGPATAPNPPARASDPGPSATAARASAAPAVAEVTAATSRSAVALTFHGDGTPALADALFSEAERAGARITVMAVGRWLDAYPEMAKRVLDGGHELGNHTQHHIDISALSPDDAYAEIETCAARLQQLTGSRGRWFRPSQAKYATATVCAAAVRAGYPTVLSYDVDSLDYTDPATNQIIDKVLSSVRGGDVVSMHLGHRATIESLPAILDGLRARGLQAVTASDLLQYPKSGEVTAR
jgi:peptidoglycan/xylan/chitin deacetylase (PgdA/CDA1 family)